MTQFLATNPAFFYLCVGLLGLIVGSFLNVVIVRLPRMLETGWRVSAAEILGQPVAGDTVHMNLAQPRSACPACGAPIRARHNIPVLSFIWLRGRCAGCGVRISWQYPLVELTGALMALAVAWRFGPTMMCAFALIFSWALLTLAVIDWRTQFLPDAITLPLLWLGLIISVGHVFVDPATAIAGAAAGYGVLWAVFHLFRLATGKEGMGYGDFKLLAALGAWLGWQTLPQLLFLASVAGALVGGALMLSGRLKRGAPMPFGPYLAAAGWLALMAGDTIRRAYLSIAGLS